MQIHYLVSLKWLNFQLADDIHGILVWSLTHWKTLLMAPSLPVQWSFLSKSDQLTPSTSHAVVTTFMPHCYHLITYTPIYGHKEASLSHFFGGYLTFFCLTVYKDGCQAAKWRLCQTNDARCSVWQIVTGCSWATPSDAVCHVDKQHLVVVTCKKTFL